jgi:hypothetical protein
VSADWDRSAGADGLGRGLSDWDTGGKVAAWRSAPHLRHRPQSSRVGGHAILRTAEAPLTPIR